jgi:hypothetical protein
LRCESLQLRAIRGIFVKITSKGLGGNVQKSQFPDVNVCERRSIPHHRKCRSLERASALVDADSYPSATNQTGHRPGCLALVRRQCANRPPDVATMLRSSACVSARRRLFRAWQLHRNVGGRAHHSRASVRISVALEHFQQKKEFLGEHCASLRCLSGCMFSSTRP